MPLIENETGPVSGTELILVRHSLPVLDPSVSPAGWQLSEVGRQRARRLGEELAGRLQGQALAIIFSSHEPKAFETASVMANILRQPVQIASGLHEHERPAAGVHEPEKFQDKVAELFARPDILVFGSETANLAHRRFQTAIQPLLDQHPDQTLVVVSHGTVMTLFVSRLAGLEPFSLWKRLGLPSYVRLTRPGLELAQIVEEVGD